MHVCYPFKFILEISPTNLKELEISHELMMRRKMSRLYEADRDILPLSPLEAVLHRNIKDIPIVIGSAAQAVDFWPGPEDLPSWSWNQYRKYVTTSLDSFDPRISQLTMQLYNTSETYGKIEKAWRAVTPLTIQNDSPMLNLADVHDMKNNAEPSLWETFPVQDLTFDNYDEQVDMNIVVLADLSDAEIVALDHNNTESDEEE
ncbi:cholinesterase [Trichonephila clavata]|uniref:Cholinesterase n=1 Tax=Trichonephila clavata TaxID=2740835 RepID=A0A8X6M0Q1_TRICU|nr:cholinesterase [Trichonephila clavata]